METKLVEITRSKYGYGFTLSGEIPCRLTQVKGHASSAGLKSGDRLLAVNGQNVEQMPHVQVVELITSAPSGRLLLGVSPGHDSYCSTSSDLEEDEVDGQQPIMEQSTLTTSRRYHASDRSEATSSTSNSPSEYGPCPRSHCRHRRTRNSRHHSHQYRSLHKSQKRYRLQTVLSPSQTYECSSRKQSSHHKNKRNSESNGKQPHSRPETSLHSDSEMVSSLMVKQFEGQWKKAKQGHRNTRFKSIDNLLMSDHDEDELMLHQHYRNRIKGSYSTKKTECGKNGNKENVEQRFDANVTSGIKPLTHGMRSSSMAIESECDVPPMPGQRLNANKVSVQVDIHRAASNNRIYDQVSAYDHSKRHQDLMKEHVKKDNERNMEMLGGRKAVKNEKSLRKTRKANSTTSGISSISPSSNSTSPSSTATRNLEHRSQHYDTTSSGGSMNKSKTCPESVDCHSEAIVRSVLLCLGASTHRLANLEANEAISDTARNQLLLVSRRTRPDSMATLLAVYPTHLRLISSSHSIDLTIEADQLLHCSFLPTDKSYFSLLVREYDNSPQLWTRCFVFWVDRSWSQSHWNHRHFADSFGITCTEDPITGNCLEFPETSESILRIIYSLYRRQLGDKLGHGISRLAGSTNLHPIDRPISEHFSSSLYLCDTAESRVKSMTLQSTVTSASDSGMHTEHECSTTGSRSRNRRVPPPPPRPSFATPSAEVIESLADADSSPSCCATTSCDSFSFQQFQQHLCQQQNQWRHMRARALDPLSGNLVAGSKPNSASWRQATAAPAPSSISGASNVPVTHWQQCPQNQSQLPVARASHVSGQSNGTTGLALAARHSVLVSQLTDQSKPLQQASIERQPAPPPNCDPSRARLMSIGDNHSQSVLYPCRYSPLPRLASHPPAHLLFASHTDLSFNSRQLEEHFSPTNVREVTKKYLNSCLTISGIPNQNTFGSNTASPNYNLEPCRQAQVETAGSVMECNLTKEISMLSMSDCCSSTVATGGSSEPAGVTGTDDLHSSYCPSSSRDKDQPSPGVYLRQPTHDLDEVQSQNTQPPTESSADEANSAFSVPNPKTLTMRSVAEDDAPPPSDEQQPLSGKLSFPPSAIHDEYGWMESPPEYPITERGVDVGLVGGWASDFDMLLSDSIGIKAFTDFLRKEFSSENLQFFLAVQEFKKLTSQSDIETRGREIYDNFISPSAPEPVNLDSKARKLIETAMENGASPSLFALAEKQIYHLMKFDSYHRFLKSDIYKECSFLESKGKRLPYETSEETSEASGSIEPSAGPSSTDSSAKSLPKSKRRSIIPWARIKNSINNKAASISSMPSKESSFKKPMMMRKITNSITKIRSKSLDDHITNHIKHHETHSSSMDKAVMENQESLNLGLSRNSLVPNSSDSIDLSEHNNVFSPSPDSKEKEISRLASLSNESSESHSSPVHQKPAPSDEGCSTSSQPTSSSFNHNCNRDNCHLLRIVFPDRSQTVVPSTPKETLEKLLERLIEKRGLNYRAFEAFATGHEKKLDLKINTDTLGCTELRVERRALFQLDLPNGDVLGIKCHPSKTCSEVLRPLMMRHGFKPEYYMLTVMATGAPVTGSELIGEMDGHRINVNLSEDLEEWGPTFTNIPFALTLSSNKTGENGSDLNIIDESALDDSDVTVTHSVAYHNVEQSHNNSGAQLVNLSSSMQVLSPSDDTKSDAFLRELVKSAQCVPSPPRNEPAAYFSHPSQPFQQECTYSAAYGIIQPRIQHPLQYSSQSSPPKPIRRHHSTATYHQAPNSSHHQSTPVVYTRPKASHLRELQNHRHFQSHHSGPYSAIEHSQVQSHQTHGMLQYPVDLNTTADEMMVLGQVSTSSPSINTAAVSSSAEMTSSNPIDVDVPPEKPPLRRLQSDPPPLPPKNTMTTVMSQRAPPPRPPPLSATMVTTSTTTSHQPYLSQSRPQQCLVHEAQSAQ